MNTLPAVKLGISPCPNDTFAFYHLLHRKDLPFRLEMVIADVEELNQRTFEGELDISKVSFHLFAHVAHRYLLLDAGSALGRGCGPLLLGRPGTDLPSLSGSTIALPGRYTTATMLFQMFAASNGISPSECVQMNFADITGAVKKGKATAGIVIHETRFTYREMGLTCLQDLGQWWEDTTGMPIPLGGIIARRKLDAETIRTFDRALSESIRYGFTHIEETLEFCAKYAQEMEPNVMKQHIDLYVNSFTESLGNEGRSAIKFMFDYGARHGLFPEKKPEFAVS